MKKGRNKLGLKAFFGLVIVLIFVNMLVSASKNKKRQNNIYNVMGMQESLIKYDSKAYFAFDEYVFDSVEDINIDVVDGKLIRSEEKIFDSANSQVNTNIKKQNEFLEKRPQKNSNEDKNTMIDYLYQNRLSKLDLSFVDSINQRDNFTDKKKKLIKSYLSNDAFLVDRTGFYLTKVDGYESLINAANIDQFISDPFVIENIEKDKIQAGLKYINNKEYYILVEVDNLDKYLKLGIKDLSVSFDDQTYYVSDYSFKKSNEGKYFMKLRMNEGIDSAVKYRMTDISLNFRTIKALKIPQKAIYKVDGQTGVYTIDDGKIQFAPVKIIYNDDYDNFAFVLTSPEDVLSKAYLDRVRKNNENLNYDKDDKDYINLYEIGEFSSILLDIGSNKVGDRY